MSGAPFPTKTCSKCGETKPHASFYHNKRNKDGLASGCRLCDQQSKKTSVGSARWYMRVRAHA